MKLLHTRYYRASSNLYFLPLCWQYCFSQWGIKFCTRANDSELIFATSPHLLSLHQPHSLNRLLKCHGRNVTQPLQSGLNKIIIILNQYANSHTPFGQLSKVIFTLKFIWSHSTKNPPNQKLLLMVIKQFSSALSFLQLNGLSIIKAHIMFF